MGKVDDVPNKWFIGVGVGDAEPQAGDTKLQTRVYEAEATSTVEVASVSMGGGNVVRATVKAQLPPLEQGAEPQPLVEAGIVIITDKDKETLFNRAKFAQVNRSSSVVMNLAWEISF
jgi:hypothetical protein